MLPHERIILRPYDAAEAMDVHIAARRAEVEPETIRRWCVIHGIGRKVGSRYKVSRVAFPMFLDGNGEALAAYHKGDRSGPLVMPYISRALT